MMSSVLLSPPLEPQFSLVYVLFSVHGNSLGHVLDTSVDLQVTELEQQIYGMMDVERDVIK